MRRGLPIALPGAACVGFPGICGAQDAAERRGLRCDEGSQRRLANRLREKYERFWNRIGSQHVSMGSFSSHRLLKAEW
jgi:hypothetical protein